MGKADVGEVLWPFLSNRWCAGQKSQDCNSPKAMGPYWWWVMLLINTPQIVCNPIKHHHLTRFTNFVPSFGGFFFSFSWVMISALFEQANERDKGGKRIQSLNGKVKVEFETVQSKKERKEESGKKVVVSFDKL